MKKIFTGCTLKIIALFSMVLDHFGQIVLKNGVVLKATYSMFTDSQFNILLDIIDGLHIAGRIAFPIFCFLLVEGFIHTRNIKKYMLNLFVFAIISEPIYDLSLHGTLFDVKQQNVLFTLFLGLVILWIIEQNKKNWIISSFSIILGAFISFVCTMDGSYYGIGLISIFYLFHDNQIIKNILLIMYMYICGLNLSLSGFIDVYFLTAVSSLLFISLYNGKRGADLKYLFYIFYPGHLLLFYILSLVVELMILN